MNVLEWLPGGGLAGGEAALRREAGALMACSEAHAGHGLEITPSQAQMLCLAKRRALEDHRRLEFGPGALPLLMEAFCDSPHIAPADYADTLARLVDLFYQMKNETGDAVPDEELVAAMAEAFNTRCHGEFELLQGREMEGVIRRAMGREADALPTWRVDDGFVRDDGEDWDEYEVD